MTVKLAPELHDGLAGLEDRWRQLADASGSIFSSWEWLECWWRHFGRGRPLLVGCVPGPGGAVDAVVPMYLAARWPLRVVRLLGHGPSDQLGPVCHPAFLHQAADAWGALLWGELHCDLLLADDLPAGPDWSGPLRGRHLFTQCSPVADLAPGGWTEWLAGRSGNFRATLTRAQRRLDGHGRATYRVADDPERLSADLDDAMRLHATRWRPEGRRGGFFGREAFHREFARTALARGWLRLLLLELDGKPVGALYNFRFGSSESFYLSGREPALSDCSIGLLLHAEAIRRAHADGLAQYRFLRGAEAYKYRFADRDDSLESVGTARSAPGRAALAAAAHLHDMPYWARRRVPSPYSWATGSVPLWGRS